MLNSCQIWTEECDMAVRIEAEFGTEKALNYLIGEKRFWIFWTLLTVISTFEPKSPAFVTEIKTIFERWQLAEYLARVRHSEPFDPSVFEDEDSAKFENQSDTSQGAVEMLLVWNGPRYGCLVEK